LLIGGHSASGKTTVAAQIGLSLGIPWMMVDDLRLAFQRARVRLPEGTDALDFDKTPHFWRRPPEELRDALIAVGEVMSAPLEVVVENHVDQNAPIVIEGDGILPSLLSRPPLLERMTTIRAAFLVEPEESAILENTLAHGKGFVAGRTEAELRMDARARWLFGQWLAQEAARYDLPVVEPRPWEDAVREASRRPRMSNFARPWTDPRQPSARRFRGIVWSTTGLRYLFGDDRNQRCPCL
jgi:2-phosphoglycerate kinase